MNINQVLADLIQANRRISVLEATVPFHQRRLDAVAQTDVAQVAGASSSSTAQPTGSDISAVAAELVHAQQSISAALTAFTSRYKGTM